MGRGEHRPSDVDCDPGRPFRSDAGGDPGRCDARQAHARCRCDARGHPRLIAFALAAELLARGASQATAHAAAAIFAPAIAAITLGTVGHAAFSHRIGRNESFNHAGNAFAAAAAGISAFIWGPVVVFFLLAAMSVASLFTVFAIPAGAINYDRARGLDGDAKVERAQGKVSERPSGLSVLITCRPLLIFAACAVLFHFANAAMLPLVGQKLAVQDRNSGTSLMSACVVAAQIVMVPMALLVGAKADSWGRKRLSGPRR